jgi:hypothetical protein
MGVLVERSRGLAVGLFVFLISFELFEMVLGMCCLGCCLCSRGKPLEAIIRNLTMRQMDDLEFADGFGIVLTVVRKKMEVVNDDDLIKTIFNDGKLLRRLGNPKYSSMIDVTLIINQILLLFSWFVLFVSY